MDLEKISKIIRTKRKEKGLTQEELANRINVTEKAISRWETSRGTPDISLLIPLSEELGITVSELLKGKIDKKEDENILEIVNYIDNNKKKKNNRVLTISTIIYGVLLLLYLWYLRVDYNLCDNNKITYLGELIYNAFFISAVFFTNRFIANHYYDTLEDRKRINKISYIMIFVLYLITLFNMTVFARNLHDYTYNFVSFKTIFNYFEKPDLYNIVINVIGNIIVMMPVQFLFIKIFNLKSLKKCLLFDLVFVYLIEFLQLITFTGVFDVDDILLNLIGMSMMYALVNGKHQLLSKYKRFIITSIISVIVVLLLFYNLSWYNLGDIPTTDVLYRLIISFIVVEFIIYGIYKFFIKMKKKI